jgi:hypothetical protein
MIGFVNRFVSNSTTEQSRSKNSSPATPRCAVAAAPIAAPPTATAPSTPAAASECIDWRNAGLVDNDRSGSVVIPINHRSGFIISTRWTIHDLILCIANNRARYSAKQTTDGRTFQ